MGKTCSSCMYFDWHNTEGMLITKYYCGEMRRYVTRGNPACAKFVERSGCYLTSACVKHKGFADDCYELTVLRNFRDTYISKLKNGKELIDEYYKTAPIIVQKIDELENKEEAYNEIYEYILNCIEKINNNEHTAALNLYKEMVEKFSKRFL